MKRKQTPSLTTWLVTFLTVLALLSAAPFAYAAPKDLDEIKAAIKARGGKWVADETPFSRLSHEEKKRWLGLDESDDFEADALTWSDTMGEAMEASIPATLDWRNVDGVSYVSPVKNQGGCGSCWAFAATAGLESQVMIATGGMPADFSEQILVSCSGVGTCGGGSSINASSYIRDMGLPVESCFKYTALNTLCGNACLNWQDNTYRVLGWHKPSTTPATVSDVKNSLAVYGPVIAGMLVYSDFYSYRGGVYSYATGDYVGAHAVLIVGYDDVNQCFIVKNSWGTGWGEAGYFRIAYSEMGGTSKFGYSVVVYDGYVGDPPPPPVPACSYTLSSTSSQTFKSNGGSGSVTVNAQSTCSWTAVSSASWVAITAGARGVGTGAVAYTVQRNTTPTSRTATLTIAGQSYKVSQQAGKVR